MRIIIGLGNPGKKYDGTRHNIGFEILDVIQREWGCSPFLYNKKFNAEISEGNSKSLLVKPQTFMNLSGQSVRALLDFYKLSPDDILVIHDDLDIALEKYKIATDSSAAGHNGVQNIIDQLGTQKFKRLRVGIGEATNEGALVCRINAHNFVLEKFSEDERKKIAGIESAILEEIKNLLE